MEHSKIGELIAKAALDKFEGDAYKRVLAEVKLKDGIRRTQLLIQILGALHANKLPVN